MHDNAARGSEHEIQLSPNRDSGTRCRSHDPFRDAAKNEMCDAGSAVGVHDDQVRRLAEIEGISTRIILVNSAMANPRRNGD